MTLPTSLDGSIASHIDDIIKLIEANPNYKEQIIAWNEKINLTANYFILIMI